MEDTVCYFSLLFLLTYLSLPQNHTYDKGSVYMLFLVVYSWLSLELLLMVWPRSVCWRVVGWASDPESISNPLSHAFLLQADSCKLQFRVHSTKKVETDWKISLCICTMNLFTRVEPQLLTQKTTEHIRAKLINESRMKQPSDTHVVIKFFLKK